jgi:hypothetical protein
MALGRISGPLLRDNLYRDGVDIAFETDLLYIDVQSGRIGIKASRPAGTLTHELTVTGTTRTTDLIVDTQADIASFTLSDNIIASSNDTISLEPSGANPVVYQAKLVLDDLQISTNTIEVTTLDTDLEFNTLGSGEVNINSNVTVNGDLHATGTITADGNITFGEGSQAPGVDDTVSFVAEVSSNIVPNTNNLHDLGTTSKTWRTAYVHNVTATTVTITDLTVNQDLDVSGLSTFNGDVIFGDNSTDTVTFTSTIDSDIIPATTAFYDLGTDSLRWNVGYFSRVEIDNLVIDNNTISTTSGNDNLILQAAGTGKIYVPSNNVQIDQQLTVNGDTSLQATTINGNITQTGDVTQTGDYTQTGDTTITGNLTVSTFGQFEKIRIDGNEISTTATDTDLQLEANGAGRIYVPTDDVLIDQNLTVHGLATIADVDVTNTLTAGSFTTGDILIADNYITTQLTDSNLELKADGTGIISIPNNDVEITQDLTVGGTFTVTTGTSYLKDVEVTGDITQIGDINQTGNFTTSGTTEVTGNITGTGTLELSDITISGNVIEVTTPNTDLSLLPNGTGDIIFENIRVSNNTFIPTGTNQDIILQPNGTGSVLIDSNQSLIIPIGNNAERPASPTNGMIRYNNESNRYEGYNATYNKWLQLSGVTDYDGNTYITAESIPGANENVLSFYANGNLTATIDSTKLFAEQFETNGINIINNTISAVATDTDVNLVSSGTGSIKIDNFKIKNNRITNIVSGAITEFAETGTGYVKIAGTNGVVIPAGDNSQQPVLPEIGMIRFNTFYSFVEVFDGVSWVNVAGTASGISASQATDIGIQTVIMLG